MTKQRFYCNIVKFNMQYIFIFLNKAGKYYEWTYNIREGIPNIANTATTTMPMSSLTKL